MTVFTIAVACSFWYYKLEGKDYFSTAYKWMFKSSFGSIVYAASLRTLLSIARFFIK